MPDPWFRLSWLSLALAPAPVVVAGLLSLWIDGRRQTWDHLSDDLTVFFGLHALALGLLLVSFVSGLLAWRRRKIVLLWVVPLGALLLGAIGLLAALGLAPAWQADWL